MVRKLLSISCSRLYCCLKIVKHVISRNVPSSLLNLVVNSRIQTPHVIGIQRAPSCICIFHMRLCRDFRNGEHRQYITETQFIASSATLRNSQRIRHKSNVSESRGRIMQMPPANKQIHESTQAKFNPSLHLLRIICSIYAGVIEIGWDKTDGIFKVVRVCSQRSRTTGELLRANN